MENQIRLKWTSHQGTVLSVFDALLSTESLVDVTLACEGQYIRAHKMILSACSPYFQELINVDLNKYPIFFLKDVKYTELKALIHYMYRGEVNIAQEDLQSLLAVAQALKIRGLAEVEIGNNSITNDTIILPDIGTKRVVKQPQVVPVPPPPVPPPPVPIPMAPRSPSIQAQDNSFVFQQTVPQSISPVPISGLPAAKKSRAATYLSESSQNAQVQIKQSQLVDPNIQIQLSPSTPTLQYLDNFQTTSLSSSSSHYELLDHSHSGHSQDSDYSHDMEIVEDAELLDSTFKVEATGIIEVDLEEEEDTMSPSGLSDTLQLRNGDNSRMTEDDGMMANGSTGGEGRGAEGGQDLWRLKYDGEDLSSVGSDPDSGSEQKMNVFQCDCGKNFTEKTNLTRHQKNSCRILGHVVKPCEFCGKELRPRYMKNHVIFDCPRPTNIELGSHS